jgi:hypothetical protein
VTVFKDNQSQNRTHREKDKFSIASEAERFAGMTAGKKIRYAIELYRAARELITAGLRARKPDWTEEKIRDEVRKAFLYGFG